jgi:anthranilate phosphoribosyltransferase
VTENELKSFGAVIQRLINGKSISKQEAHDSFALILQNKQPEIQQGAFLAALAAKGETAEEIAGVWSAVMEFDTITAKIDATTPLIENSGTGMDSLKTFNVSSAAGIVASACGARLARHGARAITSKRGSIDILEKVGVDVECDVAIVAKSIDKVGIGIFNGMSPKVHPNGLGRILSQIRFGSTLNIAASLANPARPTMALRGLYSESMLDLVADVMKKIGYTRIMIVHGKDDKYDGGMDEISITGRTMMRTFGIDATPKEFRPEDVGLKTALYEDVAALDDDAASTNRFIRVLAGVDHKECVDFTCLNSAGILLAGGLVDSMSDGIERSRKSIENGSAITKLKNWVSIQSSNKQSALDRFQHCIDDAGIKF